MKYEFITAPSLSFPNLCKLCPNKVFPFFKSWLCFIKWVHFFCWELLMFNVEMTQAGR